MHARARGTGIGAATSRGAAAQRSSVHACTRAACVRASSE
jgi:hypothetical protein